MKTIQINKNNGFSLIEILVVMAIVGMLSQMTYWMYNMYVIRGQVSETFNLVTAPQRAVTMYYNEKGAFPTTLTDVSNTNFSTGKYIAEINLVEGASPTVLEVKFGNNANAEIAGQSILFIASESINNTVVWECQNATLNNAYTPSICK